MAVEGDVGVGEVVHEHEVALAGEVDERCISSGVAMSVVGLCG